jgi:Na+:H+ antiporter
MGVRVDATNNSVPFAMLAVFGTAKLLAEICERIGQPALIGEILAGAVIGPSVLGWVAPDRTLSTLSDLGVMFLLFRVGQEVKPGELHSVGRMALLVAVLGIVTPFVMGWGAMRLWGEPRVACDFVAAALVASSVSITARMLAARGLLKQKSSHIILGAAVIDDVLGMIVLAMVASLASNQVRIADLALTSALAIGFTLIVANWGSHTMNRMVPRFERILRAGEVQFNIALVALFSLVVVATFAGIAAVTGAFLAGMALSESLNERVRQLSLGVSEFLTPFFLVGIGLQLDVRVFLQPDTLALTALIALAAIVSKLAGCGLGAAKLGWSGALRVGCGMVPRGEVGMVVAQIGLRMNVISPKIYGVVVLVAILSTISGPIMLNLALRKPRPGTVS